MDKPGQVELVNALKDFAIELGRTPLRREFLARVAGAEYKTTRLFGSYSVLVSAAGLENYDDRRSKGKQRIDNSVFERNIEEHIAAYEPRADVERKPYPNIVSWSDVHRPFVNFKVQERVLECLGDVKPEFFFENGDSDDMLSHTKFPRSHNTFTPREERDLCRKQSEEFWSEAQKRSPKTKFIKMRGNHDLRPLKRILEVYPAAEDWIAEALKRDGTFDGVETIEDPRQEYMIGDIAVFHGYRSQLGAHRDYTHYNCINGHTHRGGVVFKRIRGQTLWELNTGLSGDPESKGLTYTPQKIVEWTPGFGMVDKMGPRFISV